MTHVAAHDCGQLALFAETYAVHPLPRTRRRRETGHAVPYGQLVLFTELQSPARPCGAGRATPSLRARDRRGLCSKAATATRAGRRS
jgi:hypothetical protein